MAGFDDADDVQLTLGDQLGNAGELIVDRRNCDMLIFFSPRRMLMRDLFVVADVLVIGFISALKSTRHTTTVMSIV